MSNLSTSRLPLNDQRPSDATLNALPARVLVFLSAIATRSAIRRAMYDAGFRAEDHSEGWRLLMATGSIRNSSLQAGSREKASTAIAEIHQWVTSNFRRFRAALERLHPEAAHWFADVDSRYPADSLLALAKLLEQLKSDGSGARPSRPQSQPPQSPRPLETLAQRGLDAREITRLTQLVADAQTAEWCAPTTESESEDRTPELVALYHWYRDWAESAKRFVTRKDYRLQMGLAKWREGE